ncbi:MAG: hypothetical protein EBS90_13425 [Betaproteobacteria bacterium]|nr:hypothetical protein [Betaproteobacteria bacterium]
MSQPVWNTLIRIISFLGTEASVSVSYAEECWPFSNKSEWEAARISVEDCGIPPYDPAIHARPVHGFLDRIPTPLGIAIIACATGLLMVALASLR